MSGKNLGFQHCCAIHILFGFQVNFTKKASNVSKNPEGFRGISSIPSCIPNILVSSHKNSWADWCCCAMLVANDAHIKLFNPLPMVLTMAQWCHGTMVTPDNGWCSQAVLLYSLPALYSTYGHHASCPPLCTSYYNYVHYASYPLYGPQYCWARGPIQICSHGKKDEKSEDVWNNIEPGKTATHIWYYYHWGIGYKTLGLGPIENSLKIHCALYSNCCETLHTPTNVFLIEICYYL